VYGEIVPAEAFLDQEAERTQLTQDLLSGQKVFLVAPRRYGKSSLIAVVLEAMRPAHASDGGWIGRTSRGGVIRRARWWWPDSWWPLVLLRPIGIQSGRLAGRGREWILLRPAREPRGGEVVPATS
jgi:hypothetical protein